MAIEVLKDAFLSINAVDLSDHVRQVTITRTVNLARGTAMGDAAERRLAGLFDWSMDVEFYQDYDAAKVDATMNGLVGVETAIKVRKSKTDAISATNPEYQGNGMVESYPVVAGSVGDEHMSGIAIQCSDGVDLIRDTIP